MNEAKKERRTKEELLAIIEGFETQQEKEEVPDEFPKYGSCWNSSQVAYKAQVSPITQDIKKEQYSVWMRDKWYDIPVIEVPDGFGVSSIELWHIKDKTGLFTLPGAEAIRYAFLARSEKEFGMFIKFATRIVEVKITSTYKEVITGCVDEESS